MKRTLIAAALTLLSYQVQAGVIVNNGITGSVLNTFESQAAGNVAGTISEAGATYGERFSGQTLSTAGGFDALSGTPTSPLALLANAALASNIGIGVFNTTNTIYGDLGGAVGEGALSILLSQATDVFGLDVVGANLGGAFTAQFFGADGSLLASITQALPSSGFYGFQATGGDMIRGISITNTDPAGIAYDNVTFNRATVTVPEPGTLALVGLALAGVGFCRRKKA